MAFALRCGSVQDVVHGGGGVEINRGKYFSEFYLFHLDRILHVVHWR